MKRNMVLTLTKKENCYQSPGYTYRMDIQGLRAVAVLLVMLFHYNHDWLPGGFVGVDVFLVISGYLITSILLAKKQSPGFSIKATVMRFYLGRLQRIAPAYYFLLLLVSVVAAVLLTESDFSFFIESLWSAIAFNSAGYFSDFGSYFAPGINELPLLHTWSLAVEMQFYLLLPLLVLVLPVNVLRWLIPVLLALFIGLAERNLLMVGDNQAVYYALYARIPEFLVGSIVALYSFGRGWSKAISNLVWFIGLLLIFASAFFINGSMSFPGIMSIPVVFGAAMVIGAGSAPLSALIRGRILVWIGALSYSLYLWHWPVLAFVRYASGRYYLNLVETVIFIVVTSVGALFSYYMIEKHFYGRIERDARTLAKQILPLVAVGLLAVLGSPYLNKLLSPDPLPEEMTRYADQQTICHGHWIGDCLRGDKEAAEEILVIGDSHAAMLNHYFDYVGNSLGIKFRVVTASSCVTFKGFNWERLPEWAKKSCKTQISNADSLLDDYDTVFIAAKWSSHLRYSEFVESLSSFFASSGQQIYLLSQVPMLRIDPLRARRWSYLGLDITGDVNLDYLSANLEVRKMAENFIRVHYIDTSELSIFSNVPLFRGDLIYVDSHHLNQLGAGEYARQSLNIMADIL